MGRKLSLVLLLLVLLLFVFPPIFQPASATSLRKIEFTAFSAVSLVVSSALLSLSSERLPLAISKKERFLSFILSLKAGTFCLASLMLIFAFFQALAVVLPQGAVGQKWAVETPNGALGWTSLVLSLAQAAFFEEVLYRQFLPKALSSLLPPKRSFTIACELLCIALFALAHKGGPLAVLNAAFCGAALRFFRRKTATIIPVFASHFAYNLTLTLFSLLS